MYYENILRIYCLILYFLSVTACLIRPWEKRFLISLGLSWLNKCLIIIRNNFTGHLEKYVSLHI